MAIVCVSSKLTIQTDKLGWRNCIIVHFCCNGFSGCRCCQISYFYQVYKKFQMNLFSKLEANSIEILKGQLTSLLSFLVLKSEFFSTVNLNREVNWPFNISIEFASRCVGLYSTPPTYLLTPLSTVSRSQTSKEGKGCAAAKASGNSASHVSSPANRVTTKLPKSRSKNAQLELCSFKIHESELRFKIRLLKKN